MSELAKHQPSLPPVPRIGVNIRPGVMSDVPFLDSLQKLHTKQVGWMPTKQFEGKIAAGHVLVAEEIGETRNEECGTRNEENASAGHSSVPHSAFRVPHLPAPIGYVIGNDRYLKRDDVGIIYQMNVLPGRQRAWVGAALLKAQFERSAYGCRLYCCWCAQDIAANKFWEAMGFVPLAFRTGSRTRGSRTKGKGSTPRVHIFWQKRIRAGDTTTPFWFPSQTGSGSIREDRLVLPIPPGMKWSDAMPILLPEGDRVSGVGSRVSGEGKKRLPGPSRNPDPGPRNPTNSIAVGGLRFAPPAAPKPEVATRKREPRPKAKNDPRLVAAARELRDRWMEQVTADPSLLASQGRYDLTRAIDGEPAVAMLAAPKAA